MLAFNVQSAMKRLVLDEQWRNKRLKAIRLIIRMAVGSDIYIALLRALTRMMSLSRAPACG